MFQVPEKDKVLVRIKGSFPTFPSFDNKFLQTILPGSKNQLPDS